MRPFLQVCIILSFFVSFLKAFHGQTMLNKIIYQPEIQYRRSHHSQPFKTGTSLTLQLSTDGGDDGGNVGDNNNGNKGGGGGGDEGSEASADSDGVPAALVALLAAFGKKVADLPADLQKVVNNGKLPEDALKRFLEYEKSALTSFLMKTQGFRDRMMLDASFITKCGIEIGIGGICQLAAEINQRGDKLLSQLDFVIADILTCVIANFVAVWMAAPTIKSILTSANTASMNSLQKFIASCPTNAFQTVVPGSQPFTLAQRVGSVFAAFPNLFFVGFSASVAGFGITLALSKLREAMNPELATEAEPVPVFKPALVIGAYLGVSTNLRYQIVAGLEQRILDTVFANQKLLNNIGSLLFRTGNTYVGSAMMVMTMQICGLSGDSEEENPTAIEIENFPEEDVSELPEEEDPEPLRA
mmetsp:Transcript_34905/g.44522  ORF Transcript_34905/g.44522 Transcript_34905/m.44522 type:complete len:415 (-) Transcript_34905:304-1548(-)